MSEKESLDLVSTNFFDGLELRFGFDAFDDHLHAEFLSKQDERAHHGFCLGTLHYLFHKTAVDFQSIKRQFLDIAKSRIARAKEIGADEVQGFLLGHPTPNPLKHLSTYPSAMVENAMDEATFLVPELEVP